METASSWAEVGEESITYQYHGATKVKTAVEGCSEVKVEKYKLISLCLSLPKNKSTYLNVACFDFYIQDFFVN